MRDSFQIISENGCLIAILSGESSEHSSHAFLLEPFGPRKPKSDASSTSDIASDLMVGERSERRLSVTASSVNRSFR